MSKAVEVANYLEDVVNTMGHKKDTDYIVNHLASMHRTLNQSFTGDLVIPFVRKMAKKYREGNYDGRNETACSFCNIMWEALEGRLSELGFGMTDDMRLPLV